MEGVGLRVLPDTLQCPGWPPTEDGWAVSVVWGGEGGPPPRVLFPVKCIHCFGSISFKGEARVSQGHCCGSWGTCCRLRPRILVLKLLRGPRCSPGVDTGVCGQSSGCPALQQSIKISGWKPGLALTFVCPGWKPDLQAQHRGVGDGGGQRSSSLV